MKHGFRWWMNQQSRQKLEYPTACMEDWGWNCCSNVMGGLFWGCLGFEKLKLDTANTTSMQSTNTPVLILGIDE